MTFGNTEKLAIVIEPEFREGDLVYGTLLVYAGSKQIGNRDVAAMLNIGLASFERSLKYCGHRGIPVGTYDVGKLWHALDGEYRGEEDESDEQRSRIPAIHRFVVLTNFSESFDWFMCFLVETDESEILLWKGDDRDADVNHVLLEIGTYKGVVEDLIRKKNSVLGALRE